APASPLRRVHYRMCDAGGVCQAEQTVDGAPQQLSGLAVPAPGDWTLSVWLEDEAGNVDAAKAGSVHLRFGRDPFGTAPVVRTASGLRFGGVSATRRRVVVRGRVARSA